MKLYKKIFFCLITLIMCLSSIFLIGKKNINDFANQMNINTTKEAQTIFKNKKPFNVLLLGTDTGELGRKDKGRTDTIMIATVSPNNDKIKLTSLSRDIMIKIPNHDDLDYQKLNSVFTFDGTNGIKKVVSNYLNIPIDCYVLVNMKGIDKIVDAVGGVKIKSPISFTFSPETSKPTGEHMYRFTKDQYTYEESNNYGKTWTKHEKMNGKAVLAFSRMRHEDPNGDFGRQERQRLVIKALSKKVKNINNLLNENFINSLSDSLKTDLSLNDLFTIYKNYISCTKNISTTYLKTKEYYYNNQSYQIATKQEKQTITDSIRKLLDLPQEQTGTQFGTSKDDNNEDNINLDSEQNDYANNYNKQANQKNNGDIDFNKIKKEEIQKTKKQLKQEQKEDKLLRDSDSDDETNKNKTNINNNNINSSNLTKNNIQNNKGETQNEINKQINQ